MPPQFPLSFASTGPPLAGAAILLITFAIALFRRIALGWTARLLLIAGLLLLTLAAGEPRWRKSSVGVVRVMVDLSPSTRGATFRNRAALDERVHQLLGDTPFEVLAFADGDAQPLPTSSTLADIPAERTAFTQAPADAVLLFSDGQFELPGIAPPIYPVIDPALDHPIDAAVTNLEGRNGTVVARIRNDGQRRDLKWSNAKADTNDPVVGRATRTATPTDDAEISASLSPGDLWPENDALSIRPAPPSELQRWWIGSRNPGNGWRQISPADLPGDAFEYPDASIIVLDNVAADALSSLQQDRLMQFARDLGGGVVVVGGEHAFAAGGYDGTPIESLSPLASSPPGPSENWIVLIDGSGSMAAEIGAGGGSRWQAEVAAATQLLPLLPPNDIVNIGSFAETIAWWSQGKRAVDSAIQLPNIAPHGPTNLEPALRQLVKGVSDRPTELLLMTDGETGLTDASGLAAALKQRQLRLHLLAIGNGPALSALRSTAITTGGSVVDAADPRQWAASARHLLRSAMPKRVQRESIHVLFEGELAPLGERVAMLWNRTWEKAGATRLARATDGTAMAARWQLGLGRAAAIALSADVQDVERLAELVTVSPTDPRFKVTWTCGPKLEVAVDAVDRGSYINGQMLVLELFDPASRAKPLAVAIPQIAPGRYSVSVDSPRAPVVASVRDSQGNVLKRFAVAGRYAAEFDAIGNDRDRLTELANRTGGALIEPGSTPPLNLRRVSEQRSLTPWLSSLGAVTIAAAMLSWRNEQR